jgi:hypothetical protein
MGRVVRASHETARAVRARNVRRGPAQRAGFRRMPLQRAAGTRSASSAVCYSDAILAREPDGGGLPREAMGRHAAYFIEVFVAKEFLDGWTTSVARPTSAREQCERLIQYAITDA